MAGRSPRRVIRNPQKMQNPRVLAPIDQIQQHYGGRAATEAAIKDAEELARQLSVIHDPNFVGPGGYRDMFPQIDYSNYQDDLVVNPVPADMVNTPGSNPPIGEPDGGVLMMPEDDMLTQTGQIQMRTGEFIDAPDEALDMPSISFAQDMPRKTPVVHSTPEDIGQYVDPYTQGFDDFSPSIDEDLRKIEEGYRLGSLARSVEMPMTEYVTMTPLERQSGVDWRSSLGGDIDQTLAQIRRTAGAQSLDPDAARSLIANAAERSVIRDENGKIVGYLGKEALDTQTGLTMDRLAELARLPPEVQAFLPQRIRELLTLGGVTSGLLGAGGSSDRKGIDPRSTTGPLSGLTDF